METFKKVEEIKQLGKELMKRKSFKDRQKCMSESLDYFSFAYPEAYSLLYREIKRRELESNDPCKITKWLNFPNSNLYAKLHEALILVKSHNLMVKEEYINVLQQLLSQTFENGTNIEGAVKICHVIEKFPHLRSIHERLIHHIQHIKQLNNSQHSTPLTQTLKVLSKNDFNKFQKNNFEKLNFGYSQNTHQQQKQNMPDNPTKLQHKSLACAHGGECFRSNHLKMIAIANQFPEYNLSLASFNITIVSQDMIVAVAKWLHYLKLHKYQWFFNELSYLEIEFVDEDNIEAFITKVNKNSITKGAQKKICISTKALRDRKQKFKDLLITLDLEVTLNELCEIMTYMKDILHYPIPNKNCVIGNQLQEDIVHIMKKSLSQLLGKLTASRSLLITSLLGTSINKYLECTLLISENQIFTKNQVDFILFFAETLKLNVYQKPINTKQ